MSIRPGVVRKDLHRNEWKAVPAAAEDDSMEDGGGGQPSSLHSLYQRGARQSILASAGTARSSSQRAQSARTAVSHRSTGGSSIASTRATIFTPRKTSDPLYLQERTPPQCHNGRCCKEVEEQSHYRLLPAFQGTFGPPPDYEKNKPIYPVDASPMKRPLSPKAGRAAASMLKTFEAHLPFVSGSLPVMEQVVQQMEIPRPPSFDPRSSFAPSSLRRKSAGSPSKTAAFTTPLSPATPVVHSTTSGSSPRRPASGSTLGKQQRHAWIINALREEGALRRESSFVRGASGAEQVLEQRRRRERRSSSASALTADVQRALAASGRGTTVAPPPRTAAQQQEVASLIGKIQLASNFVVALVVKHTVSSLVAEYRRFVERHRPGGHHSRISFMVHHQTGLTLPQFALFLDETVSAEMSMNGSNGATGDDGGGIVSEDSIRAVFSILADGATHRLCAADLFSTIAMSLVPAVAQVNAEYFVNLFDKELSGFVPRTIFHHELIRKYTERNVDHGLIPTWRGLQALLKRLLSGNSQFVYLLNEVISAPMTAMARTRLNVDTAPHPDDPEGVFSSHGESRPLAITVREALCVIYAVEELHDYFLHNSFQKGGPQS